MEIKADNLPLIDAHAHPENMNHVITSIKKANIKVWLSSTCTRDLEMVLKYSTMPEVKAFLGLHPSKVHEEDLERFMKRLKGYVGKIAGLGEIGLDRKYRAPIEAQLQAFRAQLRLAERRKLPVVLHSRGTVKKALEELSSFSIRSALFHWFSGKKEELLRILDKGYFVSIGPPIIYSERARMVLEAYESGKLLLETDSPVYYAPIGKRADPTLIVSVYFAASKVLEKKLDELSLGLLKTANCFLQESI